MPPRSKARRETDAAPQEVRKGSIWIRRRKKIARKSIDCLTANGIRLELQAFFERYQTKTIRLQIVEPVYALPDVAPAVVSLVEAPVFKAPHGYSQFLQRKRSFTVFDYGHEGRLHENFRAHWFVEPEPMILLRSSAGDAFTYPSSDDDEEEDEFVRAGRRGGQKTRSLYELTERIDGLFVPGPLKKKDMSNG